MEVPSNLTDRYELNAHLARGGMADVYQGRDSLLGRKIAVKVLHSQFSADEAFVKRFRREAQAAANLTHPNIVGIYDWGQLDSTYFIVMELVEGRSLRDVLRSEGALLPRRAIEIAAEVSAALSVAHRAGLVHRDIKPGNILLAADGTVKVTDFGIARAWDDSQELTRTGAVMGTATYFSPEQAQGAPADERSDVYSLGVVLYEMLTGQPPFRGDSPVAVAYQHVSSDVPSPSAINGDVTPALDHIVLKAMHKDPALRYQTAEELRNDLWRVLKGDRLETTPTPPPVAPPSTVDDGATRMMTTSAPPATVPPAEGYRQLEEPPPSNNVAFVVGAFALLATLGLLLFLVLRLLNPSNEVDVVPIPNLAGMTRTEALEELRALDLFGFPEEEVNAEVEPGLVIRTEPSAGQEVEPGSQVTVFISAGAELREVPTVEGLTQEQARVRLEADGFTLGTVTTENNPDVELGLVISQNPEPGDEAPVGSAVDLLISVGPDAIPVPNVENLPEDEATARLADADLTWEIETEPSDTIAEGRVIRTEPAAGEEVEPGSVILVVVSEGPEPVVVPSLFGLTTEQAEAELAERGLELSVSSQTQIVDDVGLVGKVAAQNPAEGSELEPGENVTVSLGELRQIPVPDLAGMTETEARDELAELGLVLSIDPDRIPVDDPGLDSRVVNQDPERDTEVNPGSTVVVTLGTYVPPETTPSTVAP
jgi:eukaryotic-like serine/threonine-protein kinase